MFLSRNAPKKNPPKEHRRGPTLEALEPHRADLEAMGDTPAARDIRCLSWPGRRFPAARCRKLPCSRVSRGAGTHAYRSAARRSHDSAAVCCQCPSRNRPARLSKSIRFAAANHLCVDRHIRQCSPDRALLPAAKPNGNFVLHSSQRQIARTASTACRVHPLRAVLTRDTLVNCRLKDAAPSTPSTARPSIGRADPWRRTSCSRNGLLL